MLNNSSNPFDHTKNAILAGSDDNLIETLEKKFNLTSDEAKIIWLSCPEFQEQFSRERIQESKSRGAKRYGKEAWFKRRFKLTEMELKYIFEDLWVNLNGKYSERFIKTLTRERIAKTQLTDDAQKILLDLQSRFPEK